MILDSFRERKPFPGQDPFVVPHDGAFLLIQTVRNDRRIVIKRFTDLDRTLAGDETVEEAVTGCPAATAVDLWTIEGGGHVPAFNEHWADAIWAFMATHPKAAAAS